MAGFTIDTREVDKLAMDLAAAPARVIPEVEAVLKRGAQNIKRGMQQDFSRSRHFGQVAPTVSYDRRGFASSIGFEIGPTIGGSGSLAGVAVEGGARGGGGTVNVDAPLAGESLRVQRELGKVLAKAVLP
jgi:hypothetical protein